MFYTTIETVVDRSDIVYGALEYIETYLGGDINPGFIVALLPALRVLHLRTTLPQSSMLFTHFNDWVLYFVGTLDHSARGLQSLHKIVMHYTDDANHYLAHDVNKEAIFGIRRPHDVEWRGMGWMAGFASRSPNPRYASVSGVSKLTLKQFRGSPIEMEVMIRSIRQLRSIHTELTFDMGGQEEMLFWTVKHLADSDSRRSSLETLVIRYDLLTDHLVLPCASLKRLTALKKLELPCEALVGRPRQQDSMGVADVEMMREGEQTYTRRLRVWALARRDIPDAARPNDDTELSNAALWDCLTDIFPAQLEHLILQDYQPHDHPINLPYRWFEEFAMEKGSRLPNLRSFDVPCQFNTRWSRSRSMFTIQNHAQN